MNKFVGHFLRTAATGVLAACSALGMAQTAPAAAPDAPPLLTVDDAVHEALVHNRLVKNSMLEVDKAGFRLESMRSRRLPQIQVGAMSGELLHSFDFTFPAGVFGTYPGLGPIPSTTAKVHTPQQWSTYATGGIDQPLTQQYKIHLGIRAERLNKDLTTEQVREQKQKVAAQVRTAYYETVATQSALEAARDAVKTLEEATRFAHENEAQHTVLHGDVLQVEARLARQQYQLKVAENGLQTQHENLNQLMGRDITTGFRVDAMTELDETDLTLETARQRALDARPEVREAKLKVQLAETDRKIARAEYIPNLSFSVHYLGINNVEVVPTNVAAAGFLLTWEPFDWGRRRDKVNEKAKTVEQAHNGQQETESLVAVEVGMRFRKWQEASLLLKAARGEREAAKEKLRVTSNQFQEHAALLKDLLQAEAQSADAQYQYQQALSGYWSALAELRKAMGDE